MRDADLHQDGIVGDPVALHPVLGLPLALGQIGQIEQDRARIGRVLWSLRYALGLAVALAALVWAMQSGRSALGPVGVLINNASTFEYDAVTTATRDSWDFHMEVNLRAPFVLTQAVAKTSFLPRKTGKILNVASIGGLSGNRADSDMFTIAYNSSKAAMINFTRALATEWGRHNINVNALAPGFFPSKMSEKLIDRLEQTLLPSIPLHRFGGAEDLKGPAVFLVSDAARHITGQCLAVDGGATA